MKKDKNPEHSPGGWELIEPTLGNLDQKMKEVETEPHEERRQAESLQPPTSSGSRLHPHAVSQKQKAVSRELREYCLKGGYADSSLRANTYHQIQPSVAIPSMLS